MPDRFVIAETPDKEYEENDVLEIDRDMTYIALLSMGLIPIKSLGENHRAIVQFSESEATEIVNKLLSNQPILVDFHKVVDAMNSWKDLVTLWKAMKNKREG